MPPFDALHSTLAVSQRYFRNFVSFAENNGETITDRKSPRAVQILQHRPQRQHRRHEESAIGPPPTDKDATASIPGVIWAVVFTLPIHETATLLRFPSSAIHSRSAEIMISRAIMVAAGSVTHQCDSVRQPAPWR